MAYMVYAEMVMYQNDESRFSKALGYMKELIDSPSFRLNPSFANIWETEGEWCDESIWEINYEQTNNERGWGSPLAVGGTVLPTLISPNSFPGDDGWSKGNDGWGFMPMRLETYQMFSEQDKRRDATCWVIAEDVEYTKRYQDTHIWLQKYRPYDKNFKQSSGDQNLNYNNNYRYYRYAETLLNAAELSLRTGGSGTGEAKTWLNEVRTRAGLAGLANVTVDDVLTERRLEFVGEGKRYFDLVRAEGISGASASNKATTALVPDEYGYRTNSWTAKKKYIPIAQGELDSDPALVQNAYK
ncbi:RagB/SusD family nutrient uptake outer membrane protein [Bacteroides uniformis]